MPKSGALFYVGTVSQTVRSGNRPDFIPKDPFKGREYDEEANPLPGVTVTASSPSLIGIQSFVTISEGNFRFPSLLPGTYEIVAQLEGFQIVKRVNIIVNVGKIIEIKIQMKISPVQEERLVTAPSRTVDVSTSKISFSISSDFIVKLPIARDLYDIQNMTPGAVSDGATYRRTSAVLGGTVRSNLYTLDSVPMNNPAVSYAITNINIDVYDEVLATIGGVAGGGVFGDHCSPLSDTTILSSLGSACDHMDHVRTQLPYAMVTAIVASILYLVLGIISVQM